jgi:hypothetical protein
LFGYNAKPNVWIHDINLDRNDIVILNGSRSSADLTGMYLCNEESRNRFDFPENCKIPSMGCVKIFCGMTAPLSPTLSPDNSDLQLYWTHQNNDPVLNSSAEAVYLFDASGRVCSALAKCNDGVMKRYAPSQLERLRYSFHKLAIFLSIVRLCLLTAAGYFGFWPLLSLDRNSSSQDSDLKIEYMLWLWLGSIFFDLCERLAADRGGRVGRSVRQSYPLLCDRVASAMLYGSLVILYDKEVAAVFLGLGVLDFFTCWFHFKFTNNDSSASASSSTPQIMKLIVYKFPQLLPLFCLCSEGFLMSTFISHPIIWSNLTTMNEPILLWSIHFSRMIAILCIIKHLFLVLQLQVILTISPQEGSYNNDDDESSHGDKKKKKSLLAEMKEISDLIQNRLNRKNALTGGPLRSVKKLHAKGPSQETMNTMSNRIRQSLADRAHSILSEEEEESNVSVMDESEYDSGDGIEADNLTALRPSSKPNLQAMRRTRLSTISSDNGR